MVKRRVAIERLLALGMFLELKMSRFEKDKLNLFPIGSKQFTRCGGQTGERLYKQNPKRVQFWIGMVRQR